MTISDVLNGSLGFAPLCRLESLFNLTASRGEMLLCVQLALPFLIAPCFAAVFGWRIWRERGRLNVIDDGPRQRVDLSALRPVEAGTLAATISAFVVSCIFPTTTDPAASPGTAAVGLATVVGASLFWWDRVRRWRHAGRYDLVIDSETQVLALPITRPRTRRIAVPLRDVRSIKVREESDEEAPRRFEVVVRLSKAEAARQAIDLDQRLFTAHRRPAARRLAKWLRANVRAARSQSEPD
ncbi:hypothetical protein [Alienimonas californiensis]|uniref:Uncharacterized protein n=1 Tax=Alienimonas californiensis TaxID=2527989 RepID=A0A517PFN5_9PLAN|nr:hypothetical protein [Alienimonas californiensis]QDT18207.1 hypothetical protein CA12_43480 [Alienimonas californiensis]